MALPSPDKPIPSPSWAAHDVKGQDPHGRRGLVTRTGCFVQEAGTPGPTRCHVRRLCASTLHLERNALGRAFQGALGAVLGAWRAPQSLLPLPAELVLPFGGTPATVAPLRRPPAAWAGCAWQVRSPAPCRETRSNYSLFFVEI